MGLVPLSKSYDTMRTKQRTIANDLDVSNDINTMDSRSVMVTVICVVMVIAVGKRVRQQ